MRFDDCPVEILACINSYLDFYETSILLPLLGCKSLSKKLLLPRSVPNVMIRDDIWRKYDPQKWTGPLLPFLHFSRLVIKLPEYSIHSDPSWLLHLPSSLLHLDFEFQNAEQIWWQYSVAPPICFDTFLLTDDVRLSTSFGIKAINMSDLFPQLQHLGLLSTDRSEASQNISICKTSQISPFASLERGKVRVAWSDKLAADWVLGLPITLTSLKAPHILSRANYAYWMLSLHLPLPPALTSLLVGTGFPPGQNTILSYNDQMMDIDLDSDFKFGHLFYHLRHLTVRSNSSDDFFTERSSWQSISTNLISLKILGIDVHSKRLFPQLPPSLQSLVVQGYGNHKCPKLPALPNLSTLILSSGAYLSWPIEKDHPLPSRITNLDIFVVGSEFDSQDLPRSLIHFKVRMEGTWLPKHSMGLPKSILSFWFRTIDEGDDCHQGYFSLPDSLTKITLVSNLTLKIDDLRRLPPNLTEIHLPLSSTLLDVDVALLPRHWQILNLDSLEITGKTLSDPIGDSLTLRKISDSILPLLPPKMSQFWHLPPNTASSNTGNLCSMSFGRGLFSPPRGIKIVDFRHLVVWSEGLIPMFEDDEIQQTLQEFYSEDFAPTRGARCQLPRSLTRFSSNSRSMMRDDPLPMPLVELIVPYRAVKILPNMPNLKKLICREFLCSNPESKAPSLTHLTLHKMDHPILFFHAKSLPRTLIFLEIQSDPEGSVSWENSTFPPSLQVLISPRSSFTRKTVLELPSTLKKLVVKEINLKSTDLVSCLPTFGKSHINASFSQNSTVGSDTEFEKFISTVKEEKWTEIRERLFDYWMNLKILSNSSLLPIAENFLMACFSNLEHLEMSCKINWEISLFPLLPPLLESILIPLSNKDTVKKMMILDPIATEKDDTSNLSQMFSTRCLTTRIYFYSPLKGRVSSRRGNDPELVANQLLKPCYAALPANLKRISFSDPITHCVPRLLPRTLEILECDASQWNLASYHDLPPTLTALRIFKVSKFFRKHALSLPVNLKVLDVECLSMEDRVVADLPRTLTVLRCEGCPKLSTDCFELLPASLTAIDVPHLVHHRDTAAKLPATIRMSGSRRDSSVFSPTV